MNGRVALVTGAGSGLGAAVARRLAADGTHVIVNDLKGEAAAKVAADIGGDAVPFDVTDSAAFTAAVDGAVARHGRIDILVNNAGIVHDRPEVRERSMANMAARMEGRAEEPVRSTSTLTDEQWDRMIKTHLYGTFYGTRAALRHMEPARSGWIVNLASIYG
ncbi:MAG TPA: SDR family NAD(P)-dependent oxidoreductase, partial [Acidimicrobiales bacterium]|nr:SDR family NAD(P)-dependent oxidoreductase [Acidimicrobiales bacterium]